MPNILAHTYITTANFGEGLPDIVLGSVLPDFKSMYKARFGGLVAIRGINSELDDGIEFHHQTDQVFDRQLEKPKITEPLADDFEAVGIPYQAARLSAAFAADILVDRALLDFEEALRDFRTLRGHVTEGNTALSQGGF